ncbi:Iron-containing alcohol dehydrogenase [Blastocystis hominis]|uniref:Iron-containing alcohol dehydrogenase n=1 Tax=Blastocystis hominis TaxID=12968 RepID=D8MAQ3_BLAHO|nr:Iron-containing alcohol dehydrogenase [Blastocystis hominis]CBK25142.2 Iron-containing alcohol dehydrogenase [Blastocystis hominis]|eukprot:XP_012899190.1 Iron-containing alcohol dehydrogenase [Blastocystis hominis]
MMKAVNNFNFANTTRIVFGKGQIAQLPTLIPKDRIVYMTYGGGSIKRNGTYDQVMTALKGYEVHEFGGIEANPDFDTLMKAVAEIKKLDVNRVYLLAVGGGSVADGTKLIAAASKWDKTNDPWDLVLQTAYTITDALPIGVVLTLPATGSESNIHGVISRRALKIKHPISNDLLLPKFAILDPLTTMSLPERQTTNGVVDSFVHVCEQYITSCQNADVQDRYSEALLKVLIDNGRLVMKDPMSYVARSNIMWASTQAQNGWICQGVEEDWATHFVGHELTVYLGIDHGRTLACIQPRLLRFNFESKKEKLAQMGRRVFNLEGSDDDEIANKTIDAIVDFYEKDMKVPTHISAYDPTGDRKWVEEVEKKFLENDTHLGELGNVDAHVARQLILDSY